MADKHPRREDLLTQLKAVMPEAGEESKQAIVDWCIDRVSDAVAAYTNIAMQDLPEGLDSAIVGMAMQLLATYGWAGGDNDGVQSISEGDVSVSFKSPAEIYSEIQATNPITDNYLVLLNSFRVIRFD